MLDGRWRVATVGDGGDNSRVCAAAEDDNHLQLSVKGYVILRVRCAGSCRHVRTGLTRCRRRWTAAGGGVGSEGCARAPGALTTSELSKAQN